MIDRSDELLDETALRRALRLESDERPPLFDPATIAAAARQQPRLAAVSALVALVALVLSAVGAVAVWSTVAIFVPTLVAGAFDVGLGVLELLAVPTSATLELMQQPVVPLSLLAALAIATAYELRERRLSVAGVR